MFDVRKVLMKISTKDEAVKSGRKNNEQLPVGSNKQKSTTIGFEDIERRAYHIWLDNGCRHGKHLEDWLQAEQELEAEENIGE
jgi:hypothetical protein